MASREKSLLPDFKKGERVVILGSAVPDPKALSKSTFNPLRESSTHMGSSPEKLVYVAPFLGNKGKASFQLLFVRNPCRMLLPAVTGEAPSASKTTPQLSSAEPLNAAEDEKARETPSKTAP
ncbi:hypothetical protein N3P21_00050 [Treponema pallidum]|nr:hypothetical protein N3P21_00050 [Treponema pallidum]WBF88910.1 hypothetical protein KD941_05200 [Treponema pallidum]